MWKNIYINTNLIQNFTSKSYLFKMPNNSIADPCMGRGLVGFYANKYAKKFVGTELNKNRLAVLLERINKGKLIK